MTTPEEGPWGGRTTQGTGSGFVVDRKGGIVTDAHVVADATAITVRLANGTTAKGTVVGSNASADLAVVHVSVVAGTLAPLTLANSAAVKVGQAVLAIGSPFGFEPSAAVSDPGTPPVVTPVSQRSPPGLHARAGRVGLRRAHRGRRGADRVPRG